MSIAWIKQWEREDVVGLDVNDGRVVASHFTFKKNKPILKQLAVGEYDSQLPDRQISRAIREIWKREKLPTRTVQSCLHSRSLIVRYFRYENLNSDELPQALALEAEEALQQPSDEICMDWQLNPSRPAVSNEQTELSGTLIAAPRKTVIRHLNLIKAAGLYSIRVETSCSALSNLYSFLTKDQPPPPVCLINLTERTADIIMRSNGSNYPRTLFSANERWEENTSYLLENIQNALLYYHLKLKQPPIEKVLLTGRISKPDELQRELSKETTLPVEILDPCSAPQLGTQHLSLDRSKPNPCNLVTGVGLGLRRTDYELV